jgi:hypothetical protein
MYVQEIEFDVDKGECLSEGGFNEVKGVPVAQLRMAAEQEFGGYHGDLFDPDNKEIRIGWKFRAQAKYEDPEYGEEFTLETWVVLHNTQPKMEFSYYVIQDHELAAIEKVDELLGTIRDNPTSEEVEVADVITLEDSVTTLIREAEEVDTQVTEEAEE